MVHSWASGGKFRKRGKIIHQPVVCSMPLDRIKRSKVRLGIVSTLVSKRTQPPGRLIFRKIKHRFDTWITISRAQSVVMKAFYHPFHPDRKMHATAQKYQLMDRFERVQLGFYFSEFSRASKLLIFLDAPLVDKKGNKKERERETSRMLFFLSFFLFSPSFFFSSFGDITSRYSPLPSASIGGNTTVAGVKRRFFCAYRANSFKQYIYPV